METTTGSARGPELSRLASQAFIATSSSSGFRTAPLAVTACRSQERNGSTPRPIAAFRGPGSHPSHDSSAVLRGQRRETCWQCHGRQGQRLILLRIPLTLPASLNRQSPYMLLGLRGPFVCHHQSHRSIRTCPHLGWDNDQIPLRFSVRSV